MLTWAARRLGVLDDAQRDFISFATRNRLIWANAAKHLPFADRSVDVVYTSHMMEHLTRAEVRTFLDECYRVLTAGGILRVVVPDITKLIARYQETRDADRFIEDTLLVASSPRTIVERLQFLMLGHRGHNWMYDGASLTAMLTSAGFRSAAEQPCGSTTIPDPGALDLSERADESVYVEARR